MLRIPSLKIPEILPHPDAIRSFGDNSHSYEPEFWEFQYESYRYLSRVTEVELVARYKALIRNLGSLSSPERHIIPIQSFLSSWYWYRKEHQTRLEFVLRESAIPESPPNLINDVAPLDAPARPRFPNAGDVLFRYGMRTHLKPMVSRGHVRIAPASLYEDLELGRARADEERAKHSFLSGQYTEITTKDGKHIPIIGDVRRTVSAPNYYTICLSCDWDPALFADFDADACVVIRKPGIFAQRLESVAKEQLDDWYFFHGPIEYFDPYEMTKHEVFDATICKDFRFAYQREYRYLWIHLKGREAADFKHFELGPLDDIAELHVR